MKIAIVGAGIAGLSAALFLDADHEVVVFERNDYLGGHARTLHFEHEGKRAYANPAFGYIAAAMYPHFIRLLDMLAVKRIPSPASFTLYAKPQSQSLLVTPTLSPLRLSPVFNPFMLTRLLAIQRVTHAARVLDERDDWQTTLEEFIEAQPVSTLVKNEIMYPWCAALSGVTIADAKRFSARAALKYPVHVQPESVLKPFSLQELDGGVHAYIQPLLDRLRTTTLNTSAVLRPIEKANGKFILTDAVGVQHTFDHVIMASPAFETAKLLTNLPGTDQLRRILTRFPYMKARIVVHADPKYMPVRRADWSVYNALSDGPNCEATIWCQHSGDFSYFKSWMSYLPETPKNIFADLEFYHPHFTPDYYSAQAALPAWQGQGNLWIAGSYVVDVDSHESGILSAIQIARRLNPTSANLAALLHSLPAT